MFEMFKCLKFDRNRRQPNWRSKPKKVLDSRPWPNLNERNSSVYARETTWGNAAHRCRRHSSVLRARRRDVPIVPSADMSIQNGNRKRDVIMGSALGSGTKKKKKYKNRLNKRWYTSRLYEPALAVVPRTGLSRI